ncbi:hypothetical protein RRG08_055557 [Elysia crispata]|uniref:Uncharacterized protein n=1 Tax=Elysia crispata TaxID=231223 RepID=A0AAE1AFI0_9GAST|nr:hypothetical protein RRG08_055557 [Elysia crispata]
MGEHNILVVNDHSGSKKRINYFLGLSFPCSKDSDNSTLKSTQKVRDKKSSRNFKRRFGLRVQGQTSRMFCGHTVLLFLCLATVPCIVNCPSDWQFLPPRPDITDRLTHADLTEGNWLALEKVKTCSMTQVGDSNRFQNMESKNNEDKYLVKWANDEEKYLVKWANDGNKYPVKSPKKEDKFLF